jgi:type II pantothenate kinase
MKILGIDAGCTDTKAVVFENDFITFLSINSTIDVNKYDKIGATGANANKLLDGAPLEMMSEKSEKASVNPEKASAIVLPEMACAAAGAQYLTGLKNFLLVNMGTGTSLTRVDGENAVHIGGSGMGGATLRGLFALRGQNLSPPEIAKIAENGSFHNTDLMIGEVLDGETAFLQNDDSAAYLAKLTQKTSDADFAAGIINMTAQTLMGLAILSTSPGDTIIVTGGLAAIKQIREEAAFRGKMHDRNIIFPENGAYAGAIGAAINS